MNPSKELIDALRRTAERMENTLEYSWQSSEACQAGLLAAELVAGEGEKFHFERRVLNERLWRNQFGLQQAAPERLGRCEQTGLMVAEIFRRLEEHLDDQDIAFIESFIPLKPWHRRIKDEMDEELYHSLDKHVAQHSALMLRKIADRAERLLHHGDSRSDAALEDIEVKPTKASA